MVFARLVTVIAAALFTTPTASAAAVALPFAVAQDPGQNTAPSMSVNPSVLAQGGTATISYSNRAMAGQTVVVDIDNGMQRNRQTATVEITLDANGFGSATWAVPAWMIAKFNAPSVDECSRVVVR